MWDKKNKQFCVIGAGKFGRAVAEELQKRKVSVLLVEKDEEVLKECAHLATKAVSGDAADEMVLKKLDIVSFDVVILAVGNIEQSIMISLLLKELQVPRLLAKAVTENHRKALDLIGADHVIIPEKEAGRDMVNDIIRTRFFDFFELDETVSIVEISPARKWVGKTIEETGLADKFQVFPIALRKRFASIDGKGEKTIEEKLLISPSSTEVIEEEDNLILIGENEFLNKVRNA